jgi:hypothetical protein
MLRLVADGEHATVSWLRAYRGADGRRDRAAARRVASPREVRRASTSRAIPIATQRWRCA